MPTREPGRPVHRWRWALVVLAAAVVPVAVVKRLDEDNRFCVACHLHAEIMRNMIATPPATLAGAHFRARPPGHPERCFTCHSGEGVVGWSQVTALSAWDAARWVLGDRHEPTSMRLPITNEACLKCHEKQVHGTKSSQDETDRYHELADHTGVKLPCVACHQVHRTGGSAARTWLQADTVRPQCAKCHRDMAAASGWQ